MMSNSTLAILIVIYLLTSAIGVVTGSNSLIAVPAMFQAGVAPRIAVATNMFGLVFMSIGSAIPFLRTKTVSVGELTPMLVLTAISSAIGALIAGSITDRSLQLVVSVSLIVATVFILLNRTKRRSEDAEPTSRAKAVTYILVFALGIYGGLFSGGYVTVLTAVLAGFFGMTFSRAVGATKVINVVSSTVAAAVFMWQGLVDYRLGVILAVTMFVGGYLGAHFAVKMSERALRTVFVAAVVLLAVKTIYDVLG